MKTTIDSAGRVLIPKALRASAALRPGTPLEVRLVHGQIVLEPRPLEVRIVKRGRFCVAEPVEVIEPLSEEIVEQTLESLRSGRDDAS